MTVESPGGTEGDPRDDATLLGHHVDGDPDAFAVLVSRHRDRLWAVALRTLGDPDDAADALQDALVRAFRRADTFRGDAAVTTWLHRVVVNACLDQLRRRRARPVDPVDPLDDPTLGARMDAGHGLNASAAADPELEVLRGEQREQVLAALATLPVEQRAALVLVDMQGWSVVDAAHALDCATGTVKSRCSRGRARLAPLLASLRTEDTAPRRNQASRADVPSKDHTPSEDHLSSEDYVPSEGYSPRPVGEQGTESTGRAT